MTVTDVDAREVLDLTRKRLRGGMEDLADFAGDAREVVVERYHDLESDLPVDMEQVVRRARISGWQVFRGLISLVMVIPRLVVSLLGSLSRASDHAVELGDEVAERAGEMGVRGRQALASLPVSRRERRRWRMRVVGVAAAGLALGGALGWLIARRQATIVTYDGPTMLDGEPWNTLEDSDDTGEIAPVTLDDATGADATGDNTDENDQGGSLRSVPSDDTR